MLKMVVALVGMCGSGKSEAADYFRQLGLKGVYFGKLTIDKLTKEGLEINPENERKAREEIRREYGMGGFAVLALGKIADFLKEREMVFIDGLYSTEEYEILEKNFPGQVVLIEVFVNKGVRYRRLGQRQHRPLTPEQCRDRDWAEVKNLNKGGPIALSDYKIDNSGGIDDLQNKLKQLLQELKVID